MYNTHIVTPKKFKRTYLQEIHLLKRLQKLREKTPITKMAVQLLYESYGA